MYGCRLSLTYKFPREAFIALISAPIIWIWVWVPVNEGATTKSISNKGFTCGIFHHHSTRAIYIRQADDDNKSRNHPNLQRRSANETTAQSHNEAHPHLRGRYQRILLLLSRKIANEGGKDGRVSSKRGRNSSDARIIPPLTYFLQHISTTVLPAQRDARTKTHQNYTPQILFSVVMISWHRHLFCQIAGRRRRPPGDAMVCGCGMWWQVSVKASSFASAIFGLLILVKSYALSQGSVQNYASATSYLEATGIATMTAVVFIQKTQNWPL